MQDKEKTIKALELFNEKAEELLSSTFLRTLLQTGNNVNLHVNWETGEELSSFERIGPSKDEIKAFVLDFRFFIQDNEISSFKNLKELYSSPLLNTKFEVRFDSARNELNEKLDSESSVPIEDNGEFLTRRHIINTFIYGGLAHANKEKEKLYKQWKAIPPFFPLIEREFVSSLVEVLNTIVFVKRLNSEALLELK